MQRAGRGDGGCWWWWWGCGGDEEGGGGRCAFEEFVGTADRAGEGCVEAEEGREGVFEEGTEEVGHGEWDGDRRREGRRMEVGEGE